MIYVSEPQIGPSRRSQSNARQVPSNNPRREAEGETEWRLFMPRKRKDKSTPWKAKPSWYILATKDHTVHPDLQRWVSKRMGATVTEVESSHVPMLSKPDVVIDVIRKAAAAVSEKKE